ncbi:hypothetical protein ANANG_G00277620, partial [Anguilla anguilla]
GRLRARTSGDSGETQGPHIGRLGGNSGPAHRATRGKLRARTSGDTGKFRARTRATRGNTGNQGGLGQGQGRHTGLDWGEVDTGQQRDGARQHRTGLDKTEGETDCQILAQSGDLQGQTQGQAGGEAHGDTDGHTKGQADREGEGGAQQLT